MPTTSAINAVKLKYESLDAANFPGGTRPPLYFDFAPQVDGAGAAVRPAYAVLRDNGQNPTIAGFERTTLEECAFDIEVYYSNSLDNVAAAIWAIRLNGGGIGAGLGFDYGTLSDLTLPRENYQILRGQIRYRTDSYDRNGLPVYVGTISYRVTLKEVP